MSAGGGAQSLRAELVRALGESPRPVEGLLTGGFLPAPYQPGAPVEPASKDDFYRLVRRIRAEAERNGSAQALADVGVVELLAGRPDRGVARLEEASRMASGDARLQSDLAAAYLERAAHDRDLRDVMLAASSARRATDLDPSLVEARFLYALALQRIGLHEAAERNWQDYLRLDGDSAAASEARAWLERLGKPDWKLWPAARSSLTDAALAGESSRVGQIATRFPRQTRLLAERQWLPVWGRLEAGGATAREERLLSALSVVGEAVARHSADAMLRDSVRAIHEAAGDAERRGALAAGHRAYQEGVALIDARNLAAAEARFAASREALRQGGSPFEAWAAFQLAVCAFRNHAYSEALGRLDSIAGDPRLQGYPGLLAEVHWMRGLSHSMSWELLAALSAYRRAEGLFRSYRDDEGLTAIRGLLAESFRYLGDDRRYWSFLSQSLDSIRRLQDPIRRQAVFQEAAIGTLSLGDPHLALLFQDEAVRAAESSGIWSSFAAALDRRASIHADLGDVSSGLRDLDQAELARARVGSESVRAALLGDFLYHRGRLIRQAEPRRAVTVLSRALALYEETSYPLLVPELLYERALAHSDSGDRDLERRDLWLAVETIERRGVSLAGEAWRADFLNQAQRIFDRMAEVEWEAGDLATAFEQVERGRARSLLDRTAGGRGSSSAQAARSLSAREVLARLPERTALVAYALTGERSLAWVLRGGVLEGVELAAPSVLEAELERLGELVAGDGRDGSWERALAALHAALVSPLAKHLESAGEVVFIPDRGLYGVPFPALLDATSGRYLIESHQVLVAPSASIYLHCLDRDRRLSRQSIVRPLVVGNPALGADLEALLPDLPGSLAEAEQAAALHDGSLLLTGPAATRERFLAAAPDADAIFFSGHALLDRREPLRSSLVLAPVRPSDSGALEARDLYRLELPDTRLVVLAACGSADGLAWGREGVASLARPFLAAGVPAVIATLWPVGDRKASELLIELHRRLAAGEDPASALRAAQISWIHPADGRRRPTREWAVFELLGGAAAGAARSHR